MVRGRLVYQYPDAHWPPANASWPPPPVPGALAAAAASPRDAPEGRVLTPDEIILVEDEVSRPCHQTVGITGVLELSERDDGALVVGPAEQPNQEEEARGFGGF